MRVKVRALLTVSSGLVILAACVWEFRVPGALVGIAWSILLLVVTNFDRATLIFSSFLSLFRKVGFWAEKGTIGSSIQGTVNTYSATVNEESVDLLKHKMKVKWVGPMSREAFLRNNQVIVCMEPSENQSRNLARATMLYVSDDLIRESRRFVNLKVMKAADFVVARRILALAGNMDALKCLNQEFADTALENEIKALETIGSVGLLTRVVLREYSDLSGKLPPIGASPQAETETERFCRTVEALVTKEKGVDVDTIYDGGIISVALMPVAREEASWLLDPYINFAKDCYNDEISVIYVLARGMNKLLAESVVVAVENLGLYKKEKESTYPVYLVTSKVQAYTARLTINPQRHSHKKSDAPEKAEI